MRCLACDREPPADARFCPWCGRPLEDAALMTALSTDLDMTVASMMPLLPPTAPAYLDAGSPGVVPPRRRHSASHARFDCRRPLSHRPRARARRHGHRLSGRRHEARACGGAQVSPAEPRGRRETARAVPQRSRDGTADLAPARVPRLRHRRNRRPPVPLDGVRRGRGSRRRHRAPRRRCPSRKRSS